jgi:hypothetical protein
MQNQNTATTTPLTRRLLDRLWTRWSREVELPKHSRSEGPRVGPSVQELARVGLLVGLLNQRAIPSYIRYNQRHSGYRNYLDCEALHTLRQHNLPKQAEEIIQGARLLTTLATFPINSRWGGGDGTAYYQPPDPPGGEIFEGVIHVTPDPTQYGVYLRPSSESEAITLLEDSVKLAKHEVQKAEAIFRRVTRKILPSELTEKLLSADLKRDDLPQLLKAYPQQLEALLRAVYPRTMKVLEGNPKRWVEAARAAL